MQPPAVGLSLHGHFNGTLRTWSEFVSKSGRERTDSQQVMENNMATMPFCRVCVPDTVLGTSYFQFDTPAEQTL